jgi:hypothetical protein
MMTALSLATLCLVATVLVRVTHWGQQRTHVSVTVPEALFLPDAPVFPRTPQLLADYQAVALPKLTIAIARIARVSPRRAPAVRFMEVNKEVRILDEAFTPVDSGPGVDGQWRRIQGATELPTNEPVQLRPVEMAQLEEARLIALADNLLPVEMMVAEVLAPAEKSDEVTTAQAAPAKIDEEPVFLELPKKEAAADKVAQESTAPTDEALDVAAAEEALADAPIGADEAQPEEAYGAPVGWDLPVGSHRVATPDKVKLDNDIKTFNYAGSGPAPSSVTSAGPVTTHRPTTSPINNDYSRASVPDTSPVIADNSKLAKQDFGGGSKEESQGFVGGEAVRVVIAPVVAGASKSLPLKDFAIFVQDDPAADFRANNNGEVVWQEIVAGASVRSIQVIDRSEAHVPTHADIAMVDERYEIPMLSVQKLQSYPAPKSNLPTGYVLVRMDEETADAMVDGQACHKLSLDASLKEVAPRDAVFMLFTGVEAGNRGLSIRQADGRTINRLVHVSQGELTYEMNLYLPEENVALELREEDLLAKEKRPLVISGDQVTAFFTNEKAQKAATDKYRFRATQRLLGARQYYALNHQGEELFLGVDGAARADIPSDSLMREVIRRFKLGGNSRACVVQVNLDRPAKHFQVNAQSFNHEHTSYGLVLDADGQFYESMGETSQRLFLMSENVSGEKLSDNAKLNVRIEYVDGSFRSFSTFCSPNSYLVEQL